MRLSYQLVWGLLFLLVGCASLGPLSPLVPVERALVYQPRPFPESDSLPENLPFEDAWFEAADGTQLHGWYLGHPKPRAVALFCHGNAGNIVSRGETLKILQERHGLAVMTFDYRGYGKSEGKPSERGILQDARAARARLASRAGVEETEIVLMGRSLGGAVAVDLAAQDGARGLVLASTFSSLPDAAAHHMPWMFPNLNMTQRLNSAGKIGNYSGPLLQSHGDKDLLIPIELGRKLFDAAGEPKQFFVLPGAGHNDPQTEEYRRVFDEFIASLPSSSTR
ncbi:Alpha/beta hydrolase family protein [Gimesia maris]|uniref:alpha/beta hydrolase n=1 Tax=Gimesia maris TaxID=122 RepID=UPI0011890A64|nr:alpha/beta hydrolase [Gimesia maris]QDT80932.1 Alpha/beta hydrolase family protein [Gimesia maris]